MAVEAHQGRWWDKELPDQATKSLPMLNMCYASYFACSLTQMAACTGHTLLSAKPPSEGEHSKLVSSVNFISE